MKTGLSSRVVLLLKSNRVAFMGRVANVPSCGFHVAGGRETPDGNRAGAPSRQGGAGVHETTRAAEAQRRRCGYNGISVNAGTALSGWCFIVLLFALLFSMFFASAAFAAQRLEDAAAKAPSADAALLQLVRDPQAEASLRRDAVASVMDRGSSEAIASLMAELKTSMEPGLRKAMVQGLRVCRQMPEGTADAMFAIAKDLEPALIEDAGEVVGRGMSGKMIEMVAKLAGDRAAPTHSRLIATVALGHHRTQQAAGMLVPLLDVTQTAPVRAAAFTSLTRLTGIDDHGADRDRWLMWWSQAKAMSTSDWQKHLLANFARRSEALAKQRAVLQERLITSMRQRYRAVAKEEREGVLIGMLSDPLDAVRELSLDLIREIVNTEQVGVTLTTALITRLDDTSPGVRAAATLLLRDLKNAEAADIVAKRLADEAEGDRTVLRSYLLMMKRQPRLAAIGPAIALLADSTVRSEAAGALLAGFENEPPLLGTDQKQRVADFLRGQLALDATPEPRFVELLGRVGNDDDFKQIRSWLDHEVDAVKEAAAKTWAASNRTLAPLAQRAGDPIIQAIVIPAATQRGESGDTLLALVEHRPKTEQIAVAWGRALVAMAPRVDPDAVVAADRRLMTTTDLSDLRLQMLSAAISPLLLRAAATTGEVATINVTERQFFTLSLIDLLHARAEVRIKAGDGKAAMADLDRVTQLKIDLATSQQHRHDLIAIHARILSNELDEAFVKVGKYLTGEPPAQSEQAMRDMVIDLVLQCADQCATAKQSERAGQIVARLRARLIRPVPLRLETRVAAVEERIQRLAQNP